jgi:hypothetical protein
MNRATSITRPRHNHLPTAATRRRTPGAQRVATLVMLASLGGALCAQSDPGDLDAGFGTGGQVLLDFSNSADIARGLAVQPGTASCSWWARPTTTTTTRRRTSRSRG